jgi:hypothetical protein
MTPCDPGLISFGYPRSSQKSGARQLADLLRLHVIPASKSGSNRGLAYSGFFLRTRRGRKGE